MLYPLTFQPIFKERVWGARNIERLYGKALPSGVRIGESWEISDRPGDVSVIQNGAFAGRDLRWLMESHGPALLGSVPALEGRFPLLVKILDAQDRLSLQVHPPASKAAELKGDPKTEMWFITDTRPEAALYVGLRHGVTRSEFVRRLSDGTVAACFHRHAVKTGDAMFLPSGRVHAIGGGNVIFEIQQNSDTTYRVHDWNRTGLDGKPRELHIEQSLASIDFDDFEPALAPWETEQRGDAVVRRLAACEQFTVDHLALGANKRSDLASDTMHILGVVSGELAVTTGRDSLTLQAGEFCLVPASVKAGVLATSATSFLRAVGGPKVD